MSDMRITESPILITVDGCDGVGKGIVVDALSDYFQSHGFHPVIAREQYDLWVGQAIKQIFSHPHMTELDHKTLVCLIESARRQLWHAKIVPALEAGMPVICDRFILSTYVYAHEAFSGDPCDHNDPYLRIMYDGIQNYKPTWSIVVTSEWDDVCKRLGKRQSLDGFERISAQRFDERQNKFCLYAGIGNLSGPTYSSIIHNEGGIDDLIQITHSLAESNADISSAISVDYSAVAV